MTAWRHTHPFHPTRWLVELGSLLPPSRRKLIQMAASSPARRIPPITLMKRSFVKASGSDVNYTSTASPFNCLGRKFLETLGGTK
jgi:hypothetical protein